MDWPSARPGRDCGAVPRGTCRRGQDGFGFRGRRVCPGRGSGRAATGGARRAARRQAGGGVSRSCMARTLVRRLSADSLAVRGLFNDLSPPLLGTLFSNDAAEDERFFDRLDSPFGDGHTRWWTVSSRSATRTRLVHLAARTPVRSGRGAGRGRHLLDSAPLLDRRRHDVARRIDEVRTTRASSTALTLMMNY